MGKKAKSLRHIVKMKEKRKVKEQRALAYAAMGQQAENSKRQQRKIKAAKGLRVRDSRCKNIGDLLYHPEMSVPIHKMGSDYRGRYRGLLRAATTRVNTLVRYKTGDTFYALLPASVSFLLNN